MSPQPKSLKQLKKVTAHGTGSLSVSQEYLALEDGPPIFRQDTTCPALLIELTVCAFLCTGLSPCIARLSRRFH